MDNILPTHPDSWKTMADAVNVVENHNVHHLSNDAISIYYCNSRLVFKISKQGNRRTFCQTTSRTKHHRHRDAQIQNNR